jgi:hypothetical protein
MYFLAINGTKKIIIYINVSLLAKFYITIEFWFVKNDDFFLAIYHHLVTKKIENYILFNVNTTKKITNLAT